MDDSRGAEDWYEDYSLYQRLLRDTTHTQDEVLRVLMTVDTSQSFYFDLAKAEILLQESLLKVHMFSDSFWHNNNIT